MYDCAYILFQATEESERSTDLDDAPIEALTMFSGKPIHRFERSSIMFQPVVQSL